MFQNKILFQKEEIKTKKNSVSLSIASGKRNKKKMKTRKNNRFLADSNLINSEGHIPAIWYDFAKITSGAVICYLRDALRLRLN